MDTSTQKILSEISDTLRDIEENYPELQKYLDESRSTIPKGSDASGVSEKDLKNYLNQLKEMKKKYEKM